MLLLLLLLLLLLFVNKNYDDHSIFAFARVYPLLYDCFFFERRLQCVCTVQYSTGSSNNICFAPTLSFSHYVLQYVNLSKAKPD